MPRYLIRCGLALMVALLALCGAIGAQTRAYIANFGSDNVSVLDTSSNTVIATVMVGSQPQGIAITPNGMYAYVANCGGDVWVINTSTNKVAAKIVVGGCPVGVAITPDGTRAYVTKDNAGSVAVIETSTNTVTGTIGVGTGTAPAPAGLAVSPDGAHVYVTSIAAGVETGTVTVIDTASNAVTANIDVGNIGPVDLVITPDGTRVYVAGAYGTVLVVDTSSNTVATTISVPGVTDSPVNVAISPDGSRVYVVTFGNGGMGPMAVIDTSSNSVVANVNVGIGATGVGVSPDGTRVYVTIATNVIGVGNGDVTIVDTSTNTVVDTVTVGSTPSGVAFTTGSSAPAAPAITKGGIVPATVQPGEWLTLYGTNLASGTTIWKGDFPTSLGGTSVVIGGSLAYLAYVSPTQINLQVPNLSTTGVVPVQVTTAGGNASSTVTLAQFGPEFFLLDATHVAGIILRSDGSGAYGGGSYDILGPTGSSLGYKTVAAKAGDVVELFGNGFGPTNPTVLAGQVFNGAAATTNPVTLEINGMSVAPSFAGLAGAGLYQFNLTIPSGLGTGDLPLQASVGNSQTPSGSVISLQ